MAIKFDLATIPENAVIKEATLSLYAYDKNTGTQYLNNGPKKMYPFTSSWTESSIKYSNAPKTSSTSIASSNNSSLKVWEDFDVTEYIKGVVEDGDDNYGFQVRHSSSSYGVKYRSSEYSDQEYRPKLAVSYEAVDDVPPQVTVKTPNGGEELKEGTVVNITWTAQDNVAVVSCKVSYCIDGRPNWVLIEDITGNPGTLTWTIPNTFSKTCKIKVEAFDAAGNFGNDISDLTFAIDPMTGINQNITKVTPHQVYTVTVTNVQGREIAAFKTNNPNNLTQSLPSGLNIVHIKSADKKVTKKTFLIK